MVKQSRPLILTVVTALDTAPMGVTPLGKGDIYQAICFPRDEAIMICKQYILCVITI